MLSVLVLASMLANPRCDEAWGLADRSFNNTAIIRLIRVVLGVVVLAVRRSRAVKLLVSCRCAAAVSVGGSRVVFEAGAYSLAQSRRIRVGTSLNTTSGLSIPHGLSAFPYHGRAQSTQYSVRYF